jgi:hypothetical protein
MADIFGCTDDWLVVVEVEHHFDEFQPNDDGITGLEKAEEGWSGLLDTIW